MTDLWWKVDLLASPQRLISAAPEVLHWRVTQSTSLKLTTSNSDMSLHPERAPGFARLCCTFTHHLLISSLAMQWSTGTARGVAGSILPPSAYSHLLHLPAGNMKGFVSYISEHNPPSNLSFMRRSIKKPDAQYMTSVDISLRQYRWSSGKKSPCC